MINLDTNIKIAETEGVAPISVHRISVESVGPEIAARAEQIKATLLERIERVRDKSLAYVEHAIDTGKLSPDKAITSFGVTFDKAQILKGQPTQITQDNSPERLALEFVKAMIQDGYNQQLAIEELRRFHDLAPVDIREKVAAEIAANPKLLTEGGD